MIIKTKNGFQTLNVLERVAQHRNQTVTLNKRITVDHGLGHVSHQDYHSVTLKTK